MEKLRLKMKFERLSGFDEQEFINRIKKNLEGIKAKKLNYNIMDDVYVFEVYYEPLLGDISYQYVLGCFSSIWVEYPYVRNLSIPSDEMTLERVRE